MTYILNKMEEKRWFDTTYFYVHLTLNFSDKIINIINRGICGVKIYFFPNSYILVLN